MMRVTIFAMIAATAIGQQQATLAEPVAAHQLPDHRQSLGSDAPVSAPVAPTSIPFELRDNLVSIDATINGKKLRAVLDSGAASLVVDKGFARRIGLREGENAGDVAAAGSQAEQLRPVGVKSLVVGPLRFARLPGYSVNLAQLSTSAGFPIDFLIGAPAFKYGSVTVDYTRRRVTFGPSGTRRCPAPIPLTIVHDVPVIDAEIRPTPNAEPIRLKLVVDLGTRHHALMIGGPFVRSDAGKALAESGSRQKVGHGIGGEVQGSVAHIGELRIGDLRVSDVEVALSPGSPAFEAGIVDGSLGVPFWKSGVITFDYRAGVMCIER